jgi:hypothetical protein
MVEIEGSDDIQILSESESSVIAAGKSVVPGQ